MFGGDARHTGVSPLPLNTQAPSILWQLQPMTIFSGEFPGTASQTVVGIDGTVYITDLDGVVAGIRADKSGGWTAGFLQVPMGTPAIGPDGSLYVAMSNRSFAPGNGTYVRAMGPFGGPEWSYFTPTFWPSSLTLGKDGAIFLTTEVLDPGTGSYLNGILHAINPNGTARWTHALPAGVWGSPAIRPDGTILVQGTGTLSAIMPNGLLDWELHLNRTTDSSPVTITENGTALFLSSGTLYAVGLGGTIDWKMDLGRGFTDLILDHHMIYLPQKGTTAALWAVTEDGTLAWVRPLGSGLELTGGGVMSANGLLVMRDSLGLEARSRNGDLVWESERIEAGSVDTGNMPVIGVNGTIYLYTTTPEGAAVLYALGVASVEENGNAAPVVFGLIALALVVTIGISWYMYRKRPQG
jgi:hypothetical protein